uniref:Uncharacterized protein n=1 Tax=Anguilla anguilla TaxID=7936 RepID=A0A0E9V8V2_ANGAN
MIQPVVHFP